MTEFERREFERHKARSEQQLRDLYDPRGQRRENERNEQQRHEENERQEHRGNQRHGGNNQQNSQRRNEERHEEKKQPSHEEKGFNLKKLLNFENLDLRKLINFDNFELDSDRIILIALGLMLMSNEDIDELLLLALIYIML